MDYQNKRNRSIKINTSPGADHYAADDERIIEYSSPEGGGLISFRVQDGRVHVRLYRHDSSVTVTVADESQPTASRVRVIRDKMTPTRLIAILRGTGYRAEGVKGENERGVIDGVNIWRKSERAKRYPAGTVWFTEDGINWGDAFEYDMPLDVDMDDLIERLIATMELNIDVDKL